MSEKITPEVFQRLAELASLELDEEEAEYLRQELNHQLVSVEVLDSISIDEAAETAAHGIPYTEENSAPPRPDQARMDLHRRAILEEAPEVEDGYLVVPDISHEELE
jgi:aspartyl/glutamyl-tRNA(Asn/Gln) amidotransferase C subunit